uniref:Uncharacterized protein n=1 Tax=Anguilla anguilla TaxID=7936 RepID=A0A0E9QCI0_ANGAN
MPCAKNITLNYSFPSLYALDDG